MPDRWQTYPVEFRGGLISNLSPLQHGSNAPGSARNLINFEPSTEGGYRRIEGFGKFNSNTVTGQNNILGLRTLETGRSRHVIRHPVIRNSMRVRQDRERG